MLQTINTIQTYIYIVLGSLIVIGIIFIGVVFWYLKVKKGAAIEERLDYSTFNRVDSTEYSKFDSIINTGRPGDNRALGMIKVSDRTFVGGINVQGYNYYGASADEKKRTIINSVAFFNVVEDPIQLRQTSKIIDIQHNISSVTEDAKRIEEKLIDRRAEYDSSVALFDDPDILGNDEVYEALKSRLDKLQVEMRSLEWQLSEAKEMIRYMKAVSGTEATAKKINQVLFSYTYNPDEQTEELTDEEIIMQAEKELRIKAEIYGGALEGCGCTWSVLTADDIVMLLRRHYHPLTADSVKIEQLLNSSYTALYVQGDDLREIERERVGQIRYEQELRDSEAALRKAREEARKNLAAARDITSVEAEKLFDEASKAAS